MVAYIPPPEDAVFAQLYRRYQRPVRHFSRRRTASHVGVGVSGCVLGRACSDALVVSVD